MELVIASSIKQSVHIVHSLLFRLTIPVTFDVPRLPRSKRTYIVTRIHVHSSAISMVFSAVLMAIGIWSRHDRQRSADDGALAEGGRGERST